MEQGARDDARGYLDKTLKTPGMIENRLKGLSDHEINLWRARNAEPVLAVTPRIDMYTGAAHLLLGNHSQGSDLIIAAAQQNPAEPEFLVWQALALDMTGKKDQARSLLEQASAQNQGISRGYERIKRVITK